VREICARHGVKPNLLFHAGDGNLHPNICFDERDDEQRHRVHAAGQEILRACVELGGSLSGEHGIGTAKREAMRWLHSQRALRLFRDIKRSFDPEGLANPDKMFPEPAEGPAALRPSRPLSEAAVHLVEKVRECAAAGKPMAVRGSGSRWQAAPPDCVELLTTGLNSLLDVDARNCTVTAEAGISMRVLRQELARHNFHLDAPDVGGTLGGFLAAKACADARHSVLGMRLVLADGEVVDFGGKVVKNVAGYDLNRLMLGSWGTLAVMLDVTLRLHSRPMSLAAVSPTLPFRADPWQKRVKAAFDPRNLFNPWFHPEKPQ
jgi:FAD/FMN-containing dehydrogenase